jgi:hypothetical protein
VLEKVSLPGPSAGRGAFLIAGYEVVLTPQSSAGVVGLGAGGVSIHSKFSSDELLAMADMMVEDIGEK